MNIVLIGYRGAGKSAVGQRLAQKLGYAFVDSDQEAVREIKTSIAAYVSMHGWDSFRELEASVLSRLLDGHGQVVATGGGAVTTPKVRTLLKDQPFTVWLKASPEYIVRRIKADANSRNMRPKLGQFKDLATEVETTLAQRLPLYEACSNLCVNTDVLGIDDVVAEIMHEYHLIPADFK